MIYLLEDDDSIRDLVMYTLSTQGMEVQGFDRPSKFWEAMAELPSLVLLDIMLPEEDGLSVLKKLRAAPRTARLPVIMLTANAIVGERDKYLAMGFDDFLSKPILPYHRPAYVTHGYNSFFLLTLKLH